MVGLWAWACFQLGLGFQLSWVAFMGFNGLDPNREGIQSGSFCKCPSRASILRSRGGKDKEFRSMISASSVALTTNERRFFSFSRDEHRNLPSFLLNFKMCSLLSSVSFLNSLSTMLSLMSSFASIEASFCNDDKLPTSAGALNPDSLFKEK